MENGTNTRVNVGQVLAELEAGINQEENFAILFCIYYDLLYRFFTRKGFAAETGHRLAQTSFLQIHRGLKDISPETPFEMRLLRIATSLAASAGGRSEEPEEVLIQPLDELPIESQTLSEEQLALAWDEFQQATHVRRPPPPDDTVPVLSHEATLDVAYPGPSPVSQPMEEAASSKTPGPPPISQPMEEPLPSSRRRPPKGFVTRKKFVIISLVYWIMILGLGTVCGYFWWTKYKLASYQERQDRRIESIWERADQLEQENQAIKQRSEERIKALTDQITQLTAPQLNWPIYDVYATAFLRQTGQAAKGNRIRVPPGATGLQLILAPENKGRFGGYSVEITDADGQPVWRGEGARRNPLDGFNLTLNRSLLSKDRYTIKVYGKAAAGDQLLDEYVVVLETESQ
jgi:hypothetical protein